MATSKGTDPEGPFPVASWGTWLQSTVPQRLSTVGDCRKGAPAGLSRSSGPLYLYAFRVLDRVIVGSKNSHLPKKVPLEGHPRSDVRH